MDKNLYKIIICQHCLLLLIEENEVVSFKIENVTDKAGEVFVYCKNLDTKIVSFEILNFEAKGDLKEGIPEKT